MEKRIELEKRAREANQITELNLDNCRSTSIVGLTDEYTALESLSLIDVGLVTLKGFPKLPNLKKLELSDNRISNGLNYLTTSQKLQYLNLSGNKIKDLETLKPLEEFKNLAVLDLFNNEATQIDNYRDKIFKMLPSLKFLDGFDSNDVEAPSDDEDVEDGVDSDQIDLDELAEFEKRVEAKRKMTAETKKAKDVDDLDDLDEYLKELKIKEEQSKSLEPTSTVATIAMATPTTTTTTSATNTVANNNAASSFNPSTISFAIFLYWFLAILNLANAAYYIESVEVSGDDSDVSLAQVYNDDLEEDNSDWEDGADDDDDEDEETDDEENESNAYETATTAETKDDEAGGEEEPQARGKKRKHDG